MFDVNSNLRTAAAAGRLLYTCDRKHRQRTLENLTQSFPEMDQQSLDRLARRSFEHLAQLAVEVCQLPRLIHPDSWGDMVRLKGLDQAIDILASGRPALLVTGHVGNWEIMGFLMAVWGFQVDAIARPINNPMINDWLLGIRQKRGMRVITKWNATDQMMQSLQGGGALGFIADQNAGDKGLFVPFFGRLASTYKSIGLLALNQNVPIICGYACRLDSQPRYEVGVMDIIQPQDWEGLEDPLFYITARYIRAIEKMVIAFPEQYLWMHRRWKSRPTYERLGKPVPEAMRRKLESLPWMDPSTLNQLTNPVSVG